LTSEAYQNKKATQSLVAFLQEFKLLFGTGITYSILQSFNILLLKRLRFNIVRQARNLPLENLKMVLGFGWWLTLQWDSIKNCYPNCKEMSIQYLNNLSQFCSVWISFFDSFDKLKIEIWVLTYFAFYLLRQPYIVALAIGINHLRWMDGTLAQGKFASPKYWERENERRQLSCPFGCGQKNRERGELYQSRILL